jgi:hypothetical protein
MTLDKFYEPLLPHRLGPSVLSLSFVSTSLQAGQTKTIRSGTSPSLGTERISFITLPQDGQRRIGWLSGAIIGAAPVWRGLFKRDLGLSKLPLEFVH